MAYDWVARELYVAINSGSNGNLIIVTVAVHTKCEISRKILLKKYFADKVELTINPFTG